ncbi:MAG TPA: cyanophycinase [Niastella sp.]
MSKQTKDECPTPHGTLLIIGGKEDKDDGSAKENKNKEYVPEEILKTFVTLIKKEKPVVEVITSGSSEGDASFKEYKKVFNELGLLNINHIHHNQRNNIDTEELNQRVLKADAFFFTGGNQLLLSSLYGGTHFLTTLKERYIYQNIVIAGTSAGAMALSTPMIYAGDKEVEQIGGEIKVTTGLEFLHDVCIDTHFVHRGRFVRMAQVIATNPACIGIGIDENTAIVVKNGQDAEVTGAGVIIVIEGRDMSHSNMEDFNEGKLVSIRDLRMHILSKGDKYHININNPPHK